MMGYGADPQPVVPPAPPAPTMDEWNADVAAGSKLTPAPLPKPGAVAARPLIAAVVFGGIAAVLAPKATRAQWGLGAALAGTLVFSAYQGYQLGLVEYSKSLLPTVGRST